MTSRLLIAFFCLATRLSLAGPSDSLKVDSLKAVQHSTNQRLDSLVHRVQAINRTNDSLNKELYYYRAKDDFYVMAVDRQGSHFEWFVGIFIALAGYFSYTFFQRELAKIRDEIQTHIIPLKNESQKFKNLLDETKASFCLSIGDILKFKNDEFYKSLKEETIYDLIKIVSFSNDVLDKYTEGYRISASSQKEIFIDRVYKSLVNLWACLALLDNFSSEYDKMTIEQQNYIIEQVKSIDFSSTMHFVGANLGEVSDKAIEVMASRNLILTNYTLYR